MTYSSPNKAKNILKIAFKAVSSCKVWISTILILVLWFFTTLSPIEDRSLPSPYEVIQAFIDLNNEGILLKSLGISILRVLLGLLLGIIFAVPAGILAGGSKLGNIVVDKPSHMLRSIPFPALAPILIIFLGIDETMKIALIAVGVFGPMYVNIRDGVRNIDPKLLELAQVYHVKKIYYFYIYFASWYTSKFYDRFAICNICSMGCISDLRNSQFFYWNWIHSFKSARIL